MASVPAVNRLRKEYLAITKSPPPYIKAKPLESNILEWHYIVSGPPDSPYEGGIYHGKLIFPPGYPYKPPQIQMITPNGRFKTNVPLCLSMSDFHPSTWNPAWSVASILTGLLSFMLEDTPTTGSIVTSRSLKQDLAVRSTAFNLSNPLFKRVFPDLVIQSNMQANSIIKKRRKTDRVNATTSLESGGKASENKYNLNATFYSLVVLLFFLCYYLFKSQ